MGFILPNLGMWEKSRDGAFSMGSIGGGAADVDALVFLFFVTLGFSDFLPISGKSTSFLILRSDEKFKFLETRFCNTGRWLVTHIVYSPGAVVRHSDEILKISKFQKQLVIGYKNISSYCLLATS